jgi:hypothetical protein
VAISGSSEHDESSLLEDCEAALGRTPLPFLAVRRRDKVAILLPATATDGFIAENLLLLGPTLRAGVGRTVADGLRVADSWADAKVAVEARGRAALKRIVRYDDLDLGTVLLNEIPVDRLAPKINEFRSALADNPLIYEALVSYLRHNQDVGQTARALKLHPNSVRYRLARAEAILGMSIRCSSTIVALHVALALGEDAEDTGFDGGTAPRVAEVRPIRRTRGGRHVSEGTRAVPDPQSDTGLTQELSPNGVA